MNETITYRVPGVSCGHCRAAIATEVSTVAGVETVDVDLDAKLVTVGGCDLDDAALVAAIDEAGCEAALPSSYAGLRRVWHFIVDRPLA